MIKASKWLYISLMKKILVCPLDWGIGHATRCVPIIHLLMKQGHEVIIAADGRPYAFLCREFPGNKIIRFPGFRITYARNASMMIRMLKLGPSLLRGVRMEHLALKKIVEETGAEVVISDNRYGCWHKQIPCICITHQLDIQLPAFLGFLSPLFRKINYHYLRHFQECWIPDFEIHRGLAGDLSHPETLPKNTHYIGILSRFSIQATLDSESIYFDLMVMLSGPEPQRSLLEEKIMKQLKNINLQAVVVRGVTESNEAYVLDEHIHVFSHLETPAMQQLMMKSNLIICRSGYSSIMDIVTLGRRAIFIPTPGQTEQEYLSRFLMEKKIFFSMPQENFDLIYALELCNNFPGMVIRNDYKTLQERIQAIL